MHTRYLVSAAICLALGLPRAGSADVPAVSLAAQDFVVHQTFEPEAADRVRSARDLAGGGWVTGWFDYEFRVPAQGWYRLAVEGSGAGVEYALDPGSGAEPQRYYGGNGAVEGREKIGNLWLSAGAHRLRLQRWFWTGFPSIRRIELEASREALQDRVAIRAASEIRIFRKGQCGSIDILHGGSARAETLTVFHADSITGKVYRSYDVTLPATQKLGRVPFALPCDRDGFHQLWFREAGRDISPRELRIFYYEVFDTARGERAARHAQAVAQIDCAARDPDYASGPTRVVSAAAGRYRESGDSGWTRWQRSPDAARRLMPEPGWFAYALRELEAGVGYRIDVDYPDDAWRSFAVAVRETAPLAYPVSAAVDTGGEFPVSRELQTLTLRVWPRAAAPRLVFLTPHDGSRAACARIRVYREDESGPAPPSAAGGREFVNWYEEGSNYLSLYGAPDEGPRGRRVATERWADSVAALGGTTLVPNAVAYTFALYPSQYNRFFSLPDVDELRRLMLVAERRGLRVVPELHPRADELAARPDALLVSREGRSNLYAADGRTRNHPPHYDFLDPDNRAWYLGMIGELAERYRDSPALGGVALRVSRWANPALNNLVSLDWGYGDRAMALFQSDTGIAVPRSAERYAWLMTNAKAQWIGWRCAQVAKLIGEARDRVRRARPDLKLYLLLSGTDEPLAPDFSPAGGATLAGRWRESGIDARLLSRIDGVVVVNAAYSYGRRERDAAEKGARDALLDPGALHAAAPRETQGHFVFGTYYLEATDAIVPPERLGFPASTRRTWMSAVANPAGRNALERYAVALAETDAVLLGDGGNGNTTGAPLVAEFAADFTRLPAIAFRDAPGGGDPVAVRSARLRDRLHFYAVNRERYPVQVELRLSGAKAATRLSTGEPLALRGGILEITLRPYELVAGLTEGSARVDAVVLHPPPAERERVERRVAWLEKMAHGARSSAAAELLAAASREARAALREGRLWRARTIVEESMLLAAYGALGCPSRGILDGDGPEANCPR